MTPAAAHCIADYVHLWHIFVVGERGSVSVTFPKKTYIELTKRAAIGGPMIA